MGPMILGRREPRKPLEGGDVLACLGEVWEGFTFLDDPPVHITSHGACTPTISMALELHVFLLELESCFFELLVPCPQLLYP